MIENEVPQGKARGGHARAESLTATECSKIASEEARSRWNNRETIPEIPHVLSGFKSELILGGTKLPCAVIQRANGVVSISMSRHVTAMRWRSFRVT
jgi:hypothetical protein